MRLEELAEKKKQEVTEAAAAELAQYTPQAGELSQEFVDRFCVITPPEISSPMRGVVVRPGTGGKSSKPGNILLNWKQLIVLGSEGVLTAAGAVQVPWLAPLVGLVIWNKARSLLEIHIPERDAVVIWIMWQSRSNNDLVESEGLLDKVNIELVKFNRAKMTIQELDTTTKRLERMGCIARVSENNWILRETVSTDYNYTR